MSHNVIVVRFRMQSECEIWLKFCFEIVLSQGSCFNLLVYLELYLFVETLLVNNHCNVLVNLAKLVKRYSYSPHKTFPWRVMIVGESICWDCGAL